MTTPPAAVVELGMPADADGPRGEYPRPQFVRDEWRCLNGAWEFAIDAGDSGFERGMHLPANGAAWTRSITVPFCPESSLSGIAHTDFMNAVWYRRTVEIPGEWRGRHVLLHFQAVDQDATVWVDGVEVGRHRGGFTPFTCDLHGYCQPGRASVIIVRARDHARSPQARGKQAREYANNGCVYTRTTGIWQTVWMEPVPECALKRPRLTPDFGAGVIRLDQAFTASRAGMRVRATLSDARGTVAVAEARADLGLAARLDLAIPAARRVAWAPGKPHLYAVGIELLDADGAVVDRARSYAGLRSVGIRGPAVLINGEPVFQRLVLDQGYYPDGVMTAPTDAALVRDIELSFKAGFNGARLHQKVFEERFLYHCDRLGYIVWGEFADWGCGSAGPVEDHQKPGADYVTQWLEALERDYSHPAIIGWCPLNETWQKLTDRMMVLDDVTRAMFLATKAMDPFRSVLDTSGYAHRVLETDVYDSHDYEQDPAKFAANHAGLAAGKPFQNLIGTEMQNVPYRGQPYFVSEFGGIWWKPGAAEGSASWGYGERPRTEEEFHRRFAGLCAALLDHPWMFGYCYTQLTDVHQEQNGVYAFDRSEKLDTARVRAAQVRVAAIEKAATGAAAAAVARS
jgi:beta-galactosidase/beta-glucuronidase